MPPHQHFPGPRRVLLSGSVLYLLAAMLPWYRIEGRGFVIEFSGLHELGVLVGILAVYVAVWELLRLTGLPPVDGERGDRFSAVGGLALGIVGAIFVLQRLSEGSLAYGWLVGGVLITAILAASIVLFSVAGGPEALATFAGLRDRESDDGPPPSAVSPRPRPRTPTAAELAEPGTPSPGAAWTGSPYARGMHARGAGTGDGAARDGGGSPTGPPPAVVPLVQGRRAARATRAAASPAPSSSRGGSGGRTAPAPRTRPEGAAPPSGGWPKTAAERQRDAPSLWSGHRERGGGPGRPDR